MGVFKMTRKKVLFLLSISSILVGAWFFFSLWLGGHGVRLSAWQRMIFFFAVVSVVFFGWGYKALTEESWGRWFFPLSFLFLLVFLGTDEWCSREIRSGFEGMTDAQKMLSLYGAFGQMAWQRALFFCLFLGLSFLGGVTFLFSRFLSVQKNTFSKSLLWMVGVGVLFFSIGGWWAALGQRASFAAMDRLSETGSVLNIYLSSGFFAYQWGGWLFWLGVLLAMGGLIWAGWSAKERSFLSVGGACLLLVLFFPWMQESRIATVWKSTNADGGMLREREKLSLPVIVMKESALQQKPDIVGMASSGSIGKRESAVASGWDWIFVEGDGKSSLLKKALVPPTPVDSFQEERFAKYIPSGGQASSEKRPLDLPCMASSQAHRSCCSLPKKMTRMAIDRRLSWSKVKESFLRRAKEGECAFAVAGIDAQREREEGKQPLWLFGRRPVHQWVIIAWPSKKQEQQEEKAGEWLHLSLRGSFVFEGDAKMTIEQASLRIQAWKKKCGKRCGITLSSELEVAWQEVLQVYLSLSQEWFSTSFVSGQGNRISYRIKTRVSRDSLDPNQLSSAWL
jgi:hypothetical protein